MTDRDEVYPMDMGRVVASRVRLFQAIVAGPTFVLLGISAIVNLYQAYTYNTVYEFVTNLFTSLMAGGIIFIVLVQNRLPDAGRTLTLRCEVAKSVLATGLWIWLMADAIWGPRHYSSYDPRRRITISAISVLLLLLLFYPMVVYAARARNTAVRDRSGERTPLLQGGDESGSA